MVLHTKALSNAQCNGGTVIESDSAMLQQYNCCTINIAQLYCCNIALSDSITVPPLYCALFNCCTIALLQWCTIALSHHVSLHTIALSVAPLHSCGIALFYCCTGCHCYTATRSFTISLYLNYQCCTMHSCIMVA